MNSQLTPAQCHGRLLELHEKLLKQGRFVDGVIVGAIAGCVFRQRSDGTVCQRPASQIKREFLSQANAFRRWRNESAQIRDCGLIVAQRLKIISDSIPKGVQGRPRSMTAKPARYIINELAPFFSARLAALGEDRLAKQVLASGQMGAWTDVGTPTDGWKLFEEFILTRAPQVGVAISKAELRNARRDYQRARRRQRPSR